MSWFFVSDTHFFHSNIILHCKRPWFIPEDVDEEGFWINKQVSEVRAEEMNEELIQNWNSVVKPGDNVLHCGDFAWTTSYPQTKRLLKQLNGQIHLCIGNHDSKYVYRCEGFASIKQIQEIKVDGLRIVGCHYPMMAWNQSHSGTLHVYGHTHGTMPEPMHIRAVETSVDCQNFTPISVNQLIKQMLRKTWVPPFKRDFFSDFLVRSGLNALHCSSGPVAADTADQGV